MRESRYLITVKLAASVEMLLQQTNVTPFVTFCTILFIERI